MRYLPLLLLLFSCKKNFDANAKVVVSDVQMDSLRNLDNQTITPTLWNAISPKRDSAALPVIHWLSGNLDKDEELEVVVWHESETVNRIGLAQWFDRQNDKWHLRGAVDLDFWRGQNPPRIDSAIPALIVYSYGWGSGYGAEFLHFFQYQDSIVEVMSMIEREGFSMMGGPAFRSIAGKYELQNDTHLVVHYDYVIQYSEEDEHFEDTIFAAQLDIPYFWDKQKGIFKARPPKGLEEADIEDYWTGESLDPYFEPQLDEIRQKGPKWKRRALGVWVDE